MSIAQQIATYLQTEDIGTLGTTLFYAFLPDNNSECVLVRDTGGPAPEQDYPLDNKTFQIFIRSNTYEAGDTTLQNVKSTLERIYNTTLVAGQSKFLSIHAQSSGGHIGRNEAGQDEFSINFIAKVV